MSVENLNSDDWTAGETLTADTVYQLRGGAGVAIATGASAPTSDDDGVLLVGNDSVRVASGKTVYRKRLPGSTAVVSKTEV
jgi:uncharacterized protein (DUF2345 family)